MLLQLEENIVKKLASGIYVKNAIGKLRILLMLMFRQNSREGEMTPSMRARSYLGKECHISNSDVVGKVVKMDVFSQGITNGKSDVYLTVQWTSCAAVEGASSMKFTLAEFEKRFTTSERQR